MVEACKRITGHPWFNRFIIAVILLAGIHVGIETYKEFAQRHHIVLNAIDRIILGIFVLEILLKVIAHGNRPWRYFLDPWNIFDFLIVSACLAGPFLPGDTSFLPVLRLVRILRVLRIITVIPDLRMIVGALLKSIPSMFYVCLLLGLLFYIYGAMAVFLYSENDPVHFKSLPLSMLSLYRVATLEDWTDIMYINMYGSDNYGYDGIDIARVSSSSPVGAAIFFSSFVFIGTMIVLNLVIGVIMNSMEEMRREMETEKVMRICAEDGMGKELQEIHKRLEDIKKSLAILGRQVK